MDTLELVGENGIDVVEDAGAGALRVRSNGLVKVADQQSATSPTKGSGGLAHGPTQDYLINSLGGIVNAQMPSLWWVLDDADIADVKAGTRTRALDAKIQVALDRTPVWYVPPGGYRTDNPLLMNEGSFLFSPSRQAVFYPQHNGAFLKGKNVRPDDDPLGPLRLFDGGAFGIMVYGPGTASANSIALDLRGLSRFKFYDLRLQNFKTMVRQGDGFSTYYNGFNECDMAAFDTGYFNDTLGNENKVYGGRMVDFVNGTVDANNSGNLYDGLSLETFTGSAHKTTGGPTQYIQYVGSRIESSSPTAKGFDIASNSQWTLIRSAKPITVPQLITEVSPGVPTGFETDVDLHQYHSMSGGSAVKFRTRYKVVKSLAALAAGAFRQEQFTLTGYQAGDHVELLKPNNWPNGVGMSQPIDGGSNQAFWYLKNDSGSTVNFPANMVFRVVLTRFVAGAD